MKLIIFDMDGTLVNSGSMIANTVNYVRKELGFSQMEKNYILEKVNDPLINSAEFFYGTEHFTDEQAKLFEDYYHKNCLNDLEIYDGIKELLEDLKSDFKFCVATNANSEFAHKMLGHLEISQYFNKIVGYNDVKNPKPHPDMVHKLITHINTTRDKSLLIGDSHKDTQAASNAGIDSIFATWGFSPSSDHHTVISHPKELLDIVL